MTGRAVGRRRSRPRRIGRLACIGLVACAAVAAAGDGRPRSGEGKDAVASEDDALAHLAPRHRDFLRDVAPLITEVEREVFLSFADDYQRDHFIRRFWRTRDPFPQSGRNELRESWEERASLARERYGDLVRERAKALLVLGEAPRVVHATCSDLLRPLEIWTYPEGVGGAGRMVSLVFVGRQALGHGPHRLWRPSEGLRALAALGAVSPLASDALIAQAIEGRCPRGGLVLEGVATALSIDSIGALLPPAPSDEWALALRDRSTEVDPGAEPLEAHLAWSFPGRHRSRTVVQGVVRVPRTAVQPAVRGAYRAYGFMVDGEVVARGELFERFRYRFDLPEARVGDAVDLPLVVQRYLRPGRYTMVVKVEDLTSDRVFHDRSEIVVPRVEGRTVRASASPPASPAAAAIAPMPADRQADASLTAGAAGVAPRAAGRRAAPRGTSEPVEDVWLGERLREANRALGTGDHAIQLVPPPRALTVGKLRVVARTRGEGVAKVAFALDGKNVLAKSRPPFSVELDLGRVPRPHVVRATALDAAGKPLATDEVAVNVGPHRYAVRLIEPQSGRRYQGSVHVRAAVEVPEGERLDRVELYLDDELLSTLYQPPFEQPVLLDGSGTISWVRVAAYLASGAMAEDTVLINAPDVQEEIDVHLVELFTTVVDRKNDFVEGLGIADFEVLEQGEPQRVSRFEMVRDLPIHAALVLDTSLSMVEELRDVEKAAYRFLDEVVTERDRAAVITFNDAPRLEVRFTNDRTILAGGLANLRAEGETALFDTLVFTLHYMSGLTGKRAMIVLTDGDDSKSRYGWDDVDTFARHAGVSVYIVGLSLPPNANDTRMRLRKLASDTGGGFFTISHVRALGDVYASIQQEVRSQYLLAYQSTSTDPGFRRIEVKVEGRGLKAKTLSGYFP